MKTNFFVCMMLVLCLFLGILQAQSAPTTWVHKLVESSKSKVEQAEMFFRKGEVQASFRILQNACIQDPALPPDQFLLGVLYLWNNNMANARQIFEGTAVKYPDYPGVYVMFANLALQEGRVIESSLSYQKALELIEGKSYGKLDSVTGIAVYKPYQKEAFLDQIYTGLAVIAERREKWSDAVFYLEKLLTMKPKDGLLRQKIAILNFKAGKRENAYQELCNAKLENADLESPEITMVNLYTEIKMLEQAKKWVVFALQRNPKSSTVFFQAAQWYWVNDDLAKAQETALQAKQLGAESIDLKMLLGLIAREQKKLDEAEKIFTEIHQQNPTHFAASNQLALVLINQKEKEKKEKALQIASINARLYPNHAIAVSTLGWILLQFNNVNESAKLFEAIIKSGNVTAETAYYLAHLFFKLNRLQEVKQWLEIANRSTARFLYKKEVENWLANLAKSPNLGTEENKK